MPTTVKLKSSDNKEFDLEEPVARTSTVLAELLDAHNSDEPLYYTVKDKHITSDIVAHVLKWCIQHQGQGEAEDFQDTDEEEYNQWTMRQHRDQVLFQRRRSRRVIPMTKWERTYLKSTDKSTLYGSINCAHELRIKKLRNLACKEVAYRLKQMTREQLRAEFRLPEDHDQKDDDDEIQFIGLDQSRCG